MSAIKVDGKNAKGMWVDDYAIKNMYITDNQTGEVKQPVKTFDVDGNDTFVYDGQNRTSVLIGDKTGGENSQLGVSVMASTPYLDAKVEGDYWVYTTKPNFSSRAYSGEVQQSINMYRNTILFSIMLNNIVGFELIFDGANHIIKIYYGNNIQAENIDELMSGANMFYSYNIYYDKSIRQYIIEFTMKDKIFTSSINIREGFGILKIKTYSSQAAGRSYKFTNEKAILTDGIDGNDFAPKVFNAQRAVLPYKLALKTYCTPPKFRRINNGRGLRGLTQRDLDDWYEGRWK